MRPPRWTIGGRSLSRSTVLARFPEETDRRVVGDMLRWEAELLLRLRREPDAVLVLRQAIDLMHADRLELFDLLDWALEREVWFVADEVAGSFPAKFQEDPLLLYRWAETQRKSGKTDLAEETAKPGLAIEPDRHERHLETAQRLTDRLLYDWAERELRQVAAAAKANSEIGLEVRFYLSDLLFDSEQELASAEVLREAVEAVEQDEKLLQNFNRSPDKLRALMHYRYAMHYGKLGDRPQHRAQLEEAVRHYPADLDTLIAMYRLPDADPEWRQKTKERIDSVVGRLTNLVRQYAEMVQKPANSRLRLEVLAWPISTTSTPGWSAIPRATSRRRCGQAGGRWSCRRMTRPIWTLWVAATTLGGPGKRDSLPVAGRAAGAFDAADPPPAEFFRSESARERRS